MTSKIQMAVIEYIQPEQYLLKRLKELKNKPIENNSQNKDKVLKNDYQGKRLLQTERQAIETTHQLCLQSISTYLQGISAKRPKLKEPNSKTLLNQINKAQKHIKLETRIRNTIIALESISEEALILNSEIKKMSKQNITG